MNKLADLLSELKRRRVFRVTAVYAGVAFIVSEIVANTFGDFGIPEYFNRAVYILLILGFPIVIGLAWAFDLTEKGLVRTKSKEEAAEAKAPHPIFGNKTLGVIAVLAIIVAAWALLRGPSVLKDSSVVSIGVIPFETISADSTSDAYANGVTSQLISKLGSIKDLHVFAATTMLTYKGSGKTTKTIGEELDADVLLEGDLWRSGETVLINAQLIDPRTQGHLWNDEYSREDDPSRILEIVSDVAKEVVEALRIQLTPQEAERLASAPQVNPEAHMLYIRALEIRRTGSEIAQARELLEQSLAIDSTFTPAWDLLALSPLGGGGWGSDYQKWAVDKALELDRDSPVANTALGVWQVFNKEWDAAELSFQRSLELEPLNEWALYEYGLFLYRTGRYEEAMVQLQNLLAKDPLSPQPYDGTRRVYGSLRDYESELRASQMRVMLQGVIDPDLRGIEYNLLMQQGNYAEAAVLTEQAFGDSSLQFLGAEWAAGNRERVIAIRDSLQQTGWLAEREQADPIWAARFYILLGERGIALRLLEENQESNPFQAARHFSVLGDRGRTLDLLERYFNNVDIGGYSLLSGSISIIYNKDFDPLRAESRFKDLLAQLGLTEVFDENGQLLRPLPEGF